MPRVDDYKNTIAIAQESFRKKDPRIMALNSGADYQPDAQGGTFECRFINRKIAVTWPEGQLTVPEGVKELSLQEQGLIMHYLVGASGAALTGEWITFREIPSGEFYYSAFVQRAKEPLVKTFGHQPQRLLELGTQTGGTQSDQGDVSLLIQVLPRIPVCLVIWFGDDEFPPEGNILFDASIAQYLTAEDIAVLSGAVVYPLIGMAYKR
jgi:hypothetical protein